MQHLYEIDVRVPMRDGVALAANVWHPTEGKAPALLVRLPYGKDVMMGVGHALMPDIPALLEAGYAVVVQDCRGTHRSEGEFVPHMADRNDGEDTVASDVRRTRRGLAPVRAGVAGAWGRSG